MYILLKQSSRDHEQVCGDPMFWAFGGTADLRTAHTPNLSEISVLKFTILNARKMAETVVNLLNEARNTLIQSGVIVKLTTPLHLKECS